jgi:hypothetical protein
MRQQAFLITEVDKAGLLALSRFHYLTAKQAGRLLYPNANDNNRYMQRRFKRLVDAGFVLRLCALLMPKYGQAPHVFTLACKGEQGWGNGDDSDEPASLAQLARRGHERSPDLLGQLLDGGFGEGAGLPVQQPGGQGALAGIAAMAIKRMTQQQR